MTNKNFKKQIETYNIHGLVTINVNSDTKNLIRSMSDKLAWFKENKSCFFTKNKYTINLNITDKHIFNIDKDSIDIDHKYSISQKQIIYSEKFGKIGFKAEILNLENSCITINAKHLTQTKFAWPWLLFKDLSIWTYVILPILEYIFFKEGWLITHCAAVKSKSGKAILFAGRGGSYKTTATMSFLKDGYDFISDDMIITDGYNILPFPFCIDLFNFFYLNKASEKMDFRSQIGLGIHLLKNYNNPSFKIVNAKGIEKIFALKRGNFSKNSLNDISKKEMFKILKANDVIEPASYVGPRKHIHSFFRAYSFVFPESRIEKFINYDHNIFKKIINISNSTKSLIFSKKNALVNLCAEHNNKNCFHKDL